MGLRKSFALAFGALTLGGAGVLALGLCLGYRQSGGDPNGYLVAGIVGGFGLAGLSALLWRFFDSHVARPAEKLAADLWVRADTERGGDLDAESLTYLGDLGPAAGALIKRVDREVQATAELVARETERLQSEQKKLVAVLSGVPLAVVIVSESHRIKLYDGQAAEVLEPVRPLGLGQSIFAYMDEEQLTRALENLGPDEMAPTQLATADGTRVFDATVRRFGDGSGYMMSLQCEPNLRAERPLTFDFEASDHQLSPDIREAPVDSLTYVIFDTETTGLLPDKDEVVQIGAVRALGRRIVPGESFKTLVNPGRPIPKTSTDIHGVTDAMVERAPRMRHAGARFLQFAENAVLVAHNAPFDMAFLRRHADETGAELDHPVLDTVLLGAELFGDTGALTLDFIAARLGVEIAEEARHTALGDAHATAAVFMKMLEVFCSRGAGSLGDLIAIQKKHTHILPDLNGKRAPSV